jgi:hypothetical protein
MKIVDIQIPEECSLEGRNRHDFMRRSGMTPQQQEQCLNILVSKLDPELRAATLEVARWLATEAPANLKVSPSQVQQWIADVRARNDAHLVKQSAVVYQFRRKP